MSARYVLTTDPVSFQSASIREATASDEGFFLKLRQLAEREPWYEGPRTDALWHSVWYGQRLKNPLVKLYVWEEDGVKQGAIRIDSNGEIAFDAHIGCHVVQMLRALLNFEKPGRLKATLDAGDPRADFFVKAGFEVFPATFLCYRP